ncbi:MAG: SGNH/GDSL hydrolase family protein [Chitinophagaceae bacterium]|nr:SGNH/GDSL hydrolase family protein [Chitinophagaceae bacterium]
MAKNYLALGDSYTIGEAVAEHENFPHQLVKMLMNRQLTFNDPQIIARTGWTTGDLMDAIKQKEIKIHYDLVTLLIGVNNQYRGMAIEEYEKDFEDLLELSIEFAGKQNGHVIVLSIPDWGFTPFAADRDRNKISGEIDSFNVVNKKIAKIYDVQYVDITPGSRLASSQHTLLASDGLHPSAIEYSRWANLLQPIVLGLFE